MNTSCPLHRERYGLTEPSVLVAEFSTSVEEKQGLPRMLLMPNPTEGISVVLIPESGFNGGQLRVLSMDGRVLREKRASTVRIELDLTRPANGPYLIEWVDSRGVRSVQSIIRH